MYLFSYSPRPKIRGNSDTELLGGLSSLGLAGPGDPKPKGDVEFCIFEPFNCLICYRYSVFLSFCICLYIRVCKTISYSFSLCNLNLSQLFDPPPSSISRSPHPAPSVEHPVQPPTKSPVQPLYLYSA